MRGRILSADPIRKNPNNVRWRITIDLTDNEFSYLLREGFENQKSPLYQQGIERVEHLGMSRVATMMFYIVRKAMDEAGFRD